MKNKIYLIAVAAFAVMILLSCNKESIMQTDNFKNEMSAQSNKIVSLIKNFDEKMSSSLKSGELIPLDSVVWNTEALENYTYAYPDSSSKDYQFFRSNYTLTVDANNRVLVSDVQALYNQMTADYISRLAEIPSDIKHLVFTDVALDSLVGATAYLSAARGFGFNWVLNRYWGFDEDDDWYWGTLTQEYGHPPLGKCDGTEYGVSDASDELQWRLNNPIVLPVGRIIYIDQVTLPADGDDYLDENGNPRLYIGWDYPVDNCLTNDTLTYYLIQSHYIINTSEHDGGLKPDDKSFVSVNIIDDMYYKSDWGTHLHTYEVTYGIPVDIGLPN